MSEKPPRYRTGRRAPRTPGSVRRREVLDAAADLATAEGLGPLSIGRLATAVGLSKSGLASHFESKQALELATVDRVAAAYEREVWARPRRAEAGLARLEAMLEAWIAYLEAPAFRGGCFFAAVGHELASQPGPVRDRVAHHTRAWIRALEAEARTASRQGELAPTVEPSELVFELHAFVQEANLARHLLDDPHAFTRARSAVERTLARARTRTSQTEEPQR